MSSPNAQADGFDWGQDCSEGAGSFTQHVPYYQTTDVGVIPDDRRDVFIELNADEDVDVQLVDVETGTEIIAWPNGLLNGASEGCTNWQSVRYCYSGYNGDQSSTGLGREWIRIEGLTSRETEMRVFGYAAGDADVDYTYKALSTCNEIGDGTFAQYVPLRDTIDVGDIPSGKTNVVISLDAAGGKDVDVQLWDGATPLVAWPSGTLSGAGTESMDYRGVTIEYSGYNGIDGDWGHESIKITGDLTSTLTMKAYGYQAGTAAVDYEWGVGVGKTCGGIATLQCDEGLYCKAWQGPGISDPAGSCHTKRWCESDATAHTDCTMIPHIMAVGYWGCESYQCTYKLGIKQ